MRAMGMVFPIMPETTKRTPKIMKKIDINDPKFENVDVIICLTKEMTRREIGPIERNGTMMKPLKV